MKTYSGSNAGSKIRPLLDNAEESVWIVSPWLGKEYAKLLATLSQKGIEVRIITSKVDFNLESLEILKACENQNLSYLVLDRERTDEKGVFIHAKIYLVDKKFGISGSANLTYSGLNTNVETLSIAENSDEVQQIENDFMRLWLKYEKNSLSKEALSSGTSYSIKKALPLASKGEFLETKSVQNTKLTYYPYYFFEFIFRGSVRSPPLSFEDKGFLVMDGITRQIIDDDMLINEINNKPVVDYVLNTENKYKIEIVQPKTDYRESRELALDYIIRKNTRNYKQYYQNRGGYGGVTGYDRLYVPRRYDISFLKNYLVSVPVWSIESNNTDGLRHSSSILASSGYLWRDMIYCPICQGKTRASDTVNCEVCGKVSCRNCIHETGFIFKKKLCPTCYQNRG